MSTRELKRQARAGNPDAAQVYPLRAYGIQLWIVLWAFQGAFISAIILLLHALLGAVWTIVASVPLIVLFHAILPWTRRPKPSLKLAVQVAAFLEKILIVLYPVLKFAENWVGRWIQPDPILLIQSRDELLEILHHNAEEFDHVSHDELKIAESALIYGDKKVGDYMTPLNAVNFVRADEILTPVVLGELHDSGHSRFPVYLGSNQNVIGTLYIKDAMRLKGSKTAKELMRPDVYYISEHHSLDHALKAFIKTKHHLFIVVNEFEDIVGVITIEDVIEQIIGKQILDEFDQYEDLRAVARHLAQDKSQQRDKTAV